MSIFVHNLFLGLEQSEEEAVSAALKKLGLTSKSVSSAEVRKLSVDARRKNNIRLVCSVEVCLESEQAEQTLANTLANRDIVFSAQSDLEVVVGSQKLRDRPVVVGFGPAGMFAALMLARQGYRPIVLERGGAIEEREKAVQGFWAGQAFQAENNVQFGEGGAGTFSDGKLTTRINDPLCRYVLEEMVRFGAPEEILKKAKPHVGTDKLRLVVKSIREEILRLGGEVRFNTCLTAVHTDKNNGICGCETTTGSIATQTIIFAPGHSARDTFEMLAGKDIPMLSKPFSVGVRVEHLQTDINKALYGKMAGHPRLPVGEYQLSLRQNDRAVYTFCMCPGGVVVPAASEQGGVVVNGMSYFARDGQNANSAMVVSVDSRDFGPSVLDGMYFQRRLEQAAYAMGGNHFSAPAQDVGSFLQGKAGLKQGRVTPTYARGIVPGNFEKLFPKEVYTMLQDGLANFDRKLPGFAAADTLMTGVETRTSSPVRIPRGENYQCEKLAGFYPCGEGAGYSGGIMSAAVDGLRCALALIGQYSFE
ncbi:MAG: hypothetical protein J6B40_07635 [Oscillospiraceae bacterium]|nr:hypothetical protein [Oscillospiraceae bacterium]